jgi:hypothetical protein
LLLGESGENDLKMVKMLLEEDLRKEIQKKWKREKGALAGRGLASGPLAEAGSARPRSPLPLPRARARFRARTALAATPWHAGRARPPRGGHATAWRRPGRPPGAPGRARLRPRSHLRPSALSLSRSLALAPHAQSAAVAIGARAPPRLFLPRACAILQLVLPRASPSLRRCETLI